MDPLSDVLSLLRVRSGLVSRFEGRGAWAFAFPEYASHIKFGCVLSGSFLLQIEGAAHPSALNEGDFYLLTNGLPFSTFASAADLASLRRNGPETYRAHRDDDGVVRYEGRMAVGKVNPQVGLASGRFMFEGEAAPLLLRHLPPLIHLRAADVATRPLADLLALLRWEVQERRAGATMAQTHVAGLLLIQALRAQLAAAVQPEGWLRAMADARVGAALAAMHDDLAQAWTVDRLAQVAHMSRTAFAVRFKRLVGTTPLDYLTGWRMMVARDALRRGTDTIARISDRVGYQSETSFSAAFKRSTGRSPGSYRAHSAALSLSERQ